MNNKTTMNLNIASYFLNILLSSDILTWVATDGHIKKTIKHLGLTKHQQKTVERTWHMVNRHNEIELQYKGKILQITSVNLTF